MMMLKGVTLTVNYPDDECEAAIPSEISIEQLIDFLRMLAATETEEMTSFVLVAAVAK